MSDSFLCPSPCSSYYTLRLFLPYCPALWWESILCVASQSLISVVPVSIFLSPFGSLSCFGFIFIHLFCSILTFWCLLFLFIWLWNTWATLGEVSLGLKVIGLVLVSSCPTVWGAHSSISTLKEKNRPAVHPRRAFVLYYYFSLSAPCVFGCSYPYKTMMWFKVGCFCLRLLCSQ